MQVRNAWKPLPVPFLNRNQ